MFYVYNNIRPKMLISSYQPMPWNIPEEQRPLLYCGSRLKSCDIQAVILQDYFYIRREGKRGDMKIKQMKLCFNISIIVTNTHVLYQIQNLNQCTRLHTGSSEPQPQHLVLDTIWSSIIRIQPNTP